MMLKLKSSVLLAVLSCLFFSCQKEYSLEGDVIRSTSVFTYTGAPTACLNSVVTGTYQAGVALDSTNTATISVDVTTIGTYFISTPTADGILFAGSGTFTSTGTQMIRLTGSGVPTAGLTGTFSFTPGTTNGCSFLVTVTSAGGTPGTAVFSYGGTPGTCTYAAPAGSYTAGTALTASDSVTVGVNVTTVGTYSISTPVVNGISFAATGSFTATGIQTVTLTGTGTPATDGTFSFIPSNNGCSFSITVNTAATNFLTCSFDGTPRTFNISLSGISADSTTFTITGGETADANTPFFAISLKKSPVITTGTYNQASVTNISTFCLAGYSDGVSATGWSSGLAGQAGGFTVTVTNFTTNKIEGTFSGTLYDNDGQGTNAKVISLGKFSVSF